MKALRVENLKKSYTQSQRRIDVLMGISFELNPGDTLAVVGASGIGKSTLLHCLGLLDPIDDGRILYKEKEVSGLSREDQARCRLQSIGFVFQFHYLMSELTALENVMVPLLIHGAKSKNENAEKAEYWLGRVGLKERLTHRPMQLSGGEQQRVSIARALIQSPSLILADEPTGNLDPDTAREVFDLLLEQCQHLNSALVMATHNLELARKLKSFASLQKGKLVW